MSRRKGGALGLALWVAVCAAGFPGPTAADGGGGPGQSARAKQSVVKGTIADPARWPFEVLILDGGQPLCAGALIGPRHVLTAAHCLVLTPPAQLAVVANRPNLGNSSAGELISVSAAVVHPDFRSTERHDLGVMTLTRASRAQPIDLANSAEDAAATAQGSLLRVAGWGAQIPFGVKFSQVLREATEKARLPRRCRRAYRRDFSAQTMICALGRNIRRTPFHRTACVGDSGAPLVADLPAGPRLVGVTSFGGGVAFFPLCGFRKLPSVYARVADGLTFIQPYLER